MTAAGKAVFIDKDGTLVHDLPYNVDPAMLRFTPHALQALRLLNAHGWRLFIVTNQPGLALGRFGMTQWLQHVDALGRLVYRHTGVSFAAWLMCPHAPRADGAPDCECRKPNPGMLLRAAREHGVHLSASWMVGDILNDVEAGKRAGCRSVLLDVGNETEWQVNEWRTPDLRCADLLEAAQAIVADELINVEQS
jgi:histidinol-phosphate phosphatase family protein